MHDIGKIGIPDAVLLKEGHLTEQERGTVRKHAEIGHRILHGARSTPIVLGASVAWTHHERWDGSGYPRGLAGEEIPVEGRIAAIADVFDALTSARPWRVAMPIDRALATMRTEREAHFDPVLLDAFFASMRDVDLIRAAWGDPQAA
jgi:putative two-component system response regulator